MRPIAALLLLTILASAVASPVAAHPKSEPAMEDAGPRRPVPIRQEGSDLLEGVRRAGARPGQPRRRAALVVEGQGLTRQGRSG